MAKLLDKSHFDGKPALYAEYTNYVIIETNLRCLSAGLHTKFSMKEFNRLLGVSGKTAKELAEITNKKLNKIKSDLGLL